MGGSSDEYTYYSTEEETTAKKPAAPAAKPKAAAPAAAAAKKAAQSSSSGEYYSTSSSEYYSSYESDSEEEIEHVEEAVLFDNVHSSNEDSDSNNTVYHRAIWSDIADTFANQLFFVDGDNLFIVLALQDPEFSALFNFSHHGGQVLPLVSLFEKFVDALVVRGCVFDLVFHEAFDGFVRTRFGPGAALARQALIHSMLAINARGSEYPVTVKVFKDLAFWDSASDWYRWIYTRQPVYFVTEFPGRAIRSSAGAQGEAEFAWRKALVNNARYVHFLHLVSAQTLLVTGSTMHGFVIQKPLRDDKRAEREAKELELKPSIEKWGELFPSIAALNRDHEAFAQSKPETASGRWALFAHALAKLPAVAKSELAAPVANYAAVHDTIAFKDRIGNSYDHFRAAGSNNKDSKSSSTSSSIDLFLGELALQVAHHVRRMMSSAAGAAVPWFDLWDGALFVETSAGTALHSAEAKPRMAAFLANATSGTAVPAELASGPAVKTTAVSAAETRSATLELAPGAATSIQTMFDSLSLLLTPERVAPLVQPLPLPESGTAGSSAAADVASATQASEIAALAALKPDDIWNETSREYFEPVPLPKAHKLLSHWEKKSKDKIAAQMKRIAMSMTSVASKPIVEGSQYLDEVYSMRKEELVRQDASSSAAAGAGGAGKDRRGGEKQKAGDKDGGKKGSSAASGSDKASKMKEKLNQNRENEEYQEACKNIVQNSKVPKSVQLQAMKKALPVISRNAYRGKEEADRLGKLIIDIIEVNQTEIQDKEEFRTESLRLVRDYLLTLRVPSDADASKVIDSTGAVCLPHGSRDIAKQLELKALRWALSGEGPDADTDAKEIDAEIDRLCQFMLGSMAYKLLRPMSVEDDRLNFKPDRWQQHLLDIVDKRESVLVCAPTSAGKTFICYYAMEKVLAESSDGVAIYIAPSTALVRQVQYEVVARYSKQYPSTSGRVLASLFVEGKEATDAFNCQVLVLSVENLETLFLEMRKDEHRNFRSRIKHIIFDEVHSVGAGNGDIWERMLLMVDAPILGLSATLGNVNVFFSWLKYIEEVKRSKKCHIIGMEQNFASAEERELKGPISRYNELVYSVFQSGGENPLVPLHPLWTVYDRYAETSNFALPKNITMTPNHCFDLLLCLREAEKRIAAPASPEASLFHSVDPLMYFRRLYNNGQIDAPSGDAADGSAAAGAGASSSAKDSKKDKGSKKDKKDEKEDKKDKKDKKDKESSGPNPTVQLVRRIATMTTKDVKGLQKELETTLETLYASGDAKKQQIVVEALRDVAAPAKAAFEAMAARDANRTAKEWEDLLWAMRAQDKIPAIAFSLNRKMVTYLAKCALRLCQRQHQSKLDTNAKTIESLKKEIDVLEPKAKAEEDRKSSNAPRQQMGNTAEADARGKSGGTDQSGVDLSEQAANPFMQQLADRRKRLAQLLAVDKTCSFWPKRGQGLCSKEEIFSEFGLKFEDKDPFHQCLLYGIGVHHPGFPYRYRTAVEIMYRLGRLGIVISSETLGQGINAPCKSVILADDSLRLNPVIYQQMVGRAGRRGYDDVGYVVVFRLNRAKMLRLSEAALPALNGKCILNASTALQMHMRLALYDVPAEGDKEDAKEKERQLTDLRIDLVGRPWIDKIEQRTLDGEGGIKKITTLEERRVAGYLPAMNRVLNHSIWAIQNRAMSLALKSSYLLCLDYYRLLGFLDGLFTPTNAAQSWILMSGMNQTGTLMVSLLRKHLFGLAQSWTMLDDLEVDLMSGSRPSTDPIFPHPATLNATKREEAKKQLEDRQRAAAAAAAAAAGDQPMNQHHAAKKPKKKKDLSVNTMIVSPPVPADNESVIESLLLLLCHLIHPLPIRAAPPRRTSERLQKCQKHKFVLDPLPETLQKQLDAETRQGYAFVYAGLNRHYGAGGVVVSSESNAEPQVLAASGIVVPGATRSVGADDTDSVIAPSFRILPGVRFSGENATVYRMRVLSLLVRHDIFADVTLSPFYEAPIVSGNAASNPHVSNVLWNSYAMDFYRDPGFEHDMPIEDVMHLSGIAEPWEAINGFMSELRATMSVLKYILRKTHAVLLKTIRQQNPVMLAYHREQLKLWQALKVLYLRFDDKFQFYTRKTGGFKNSLTVAIM